jgi:isopentenyl-diphosphate delta-isomerase
MEYLDVLDEKGNKTGKAVSYDEAHLAGAIHRAVHIWIVNSKNEILVQKRERNRKAYPLHWDISVGGHVSAGQTSLEAAARETKEELGLDIDQSEFKYLFTLEQHVILNGGTYVNNEFNDVYVVRKDIQIDEIKMADGEVEAVRYLRLDEFRQWILGKGELMVPHTEEYQKLLEYIS